jgi:pimeloyl-ACP methyl ester carboxylesterase
MRRLAEMAARSGMPALRFDYLGTGDSADLAGSADQLEAWTQDIVAAVRELRRLTGVHQVLVLGFRLGASLAVLAAERCRDIVGLALINPVIDGRRYLRELRAQRLAGTLGTPEGQDAAAEGIEVGGFSLHAATLLGLAALDLERLVPPRLSAGMLVIDPPTMPTARDWVAALQADVEGHPASGYEHRLLPGTVEMLMTDPQFAELPPSLVDAVREWLEGARAGTAASASAGIGEAFTNVVPMSALRLPGAEAQPRSRLTERPVTLRSGVGCFGIVTEPGEGDPRRRAVVLLNVGAEHHIGSSRLYVSLARRWARQGYTVLRFDLGGLGDSDTRPGRADDEVYPPAAIDDIRVAVDHLRNRYGVGEIVLAGICSGAYHALRAAVAGVEVSRVLLVNPLAYFWKDGMTAEDMHRALEVARSLEYYRRRLFSESLWRKLLRGQVSLWRVVRVLVQRPLLPIVAACRDWGRRFNIRLPGDLAAELEELVARGVQLSFVFSRGEPGLDRLLLQCDATIKRLAAQCRLHVIDTADHIFSRRASRSRLEDLLSREITTRNEGYVAPVLPQIVQARNRSQQC